MVVVYGSPMVIDEICVAFIIVRGATNKLKCADPVSPFQQPPRPPQCRAKDPLLSSVHVCLSGRLVCHSQSVRSTQGVSNKFNFDAFISRLCVGSAYSHSIRSLLVIIFAVPPASQQMRTRALCSQAASPQRKNETLFAIS